ncbi:unnamed protein product [Dicrocoelium dendriticum]|nr:unnamed protein product [Dicrocoelium dendriticum]
MRRPSMLLLRHSHCSRFQQDLSLLQKTDPQFVRDLTSHWMFIKRSWANYAQTGLVHFGNTTNNRVENANLRLKKITHASDRLAVAVSKVWKLSEVLLKEFQMRCTYFCDRHQVFEDEGNAYVQMLIGRLTTYAGTLVMRHLATPKFGAVYSDIGTGLVCHLVCFYFHSLLFKINTIDMTSTAQMAHALAHFTGTCGSRASIYLCYIRRINIPRVKPRNFSFPFYKTYPSVVDD